MLYLTVDNVENDSGIKNTLVYTDAALHLYFIALYCVYTNLTTT